MHCRDCGATIERTDRFCPACGTPNAQTKFHPKFGPVPTGFEPEILYEVAAAGEPACLRCERRIRDGSRWCEGCGHDLRESWSRHHRRVAVERWRRGETVPRPFRPAGRRGLALRTALVAAVGLGIAVAAGTLDLFTLPPAVPAMIAGVVAVVVVLFVAWSRRAVGNLPALGVVNRVRGRRAVLADLVRPLRLVDDLWRGSAPLDEVPVCAPSWRRGRPSRLARTWWASLVAGVLLVVAASTVDPADALDDRLAAGAEALLAASCLLLLVLVGRIDRRQARRMVAVTAVEVDEVSVPAERASVDLMGSVPTRHEALRVVAGDGRTTALNRPPSARRPVWGKY